MYVDLTSILQCDVTDTQYFVRNRYVSYIGENREDQETARELEALREQQKLAAAQTDELAGLVWRGCRPGFAAAGGGGALGDWGRKGVVPPFPLWLSLCWLSL